MPPRCASAGSFPAPARRPRRSRATSANGFTGRSSHSVAEQGYQAITVADILELSGVSRSAFYEHFANKSECLTAAAAELIEPTLAALSASNGDGSSREPHEVFEGFSRSSPGSQRRPGSASSICMPPDPRPRRSAIAPSKRWQGGIAELGARSGGRAISPEMARALVAGLRKLIHTPPRSRRRGGARGLVPELWQWLIERRGHRPDR